MTYFKAFLGAAVASLLLLLLGRTIPPTSPLATLLTVMLSVSPLIWYHLGYLRPHLNKGLSQGAVDSVYYLGFLVTLASLGLAAAGHPRGEGAIEAILSKFALGLVATGYALLARIHLQSAAPDADDGDAARRATDAADSWQRVSASAELTLSSLGRSQDDVLRAQKVALGDLRQEQLVAVRSFVSEYQDAMKAAVREAAEEIKAVRVSAISDELAAANQELLQQLKNSASVLEEINKAYSSMSRRLGTTTAALEEAGRVLREIAAHGVAEQGAYGVLSEILQGTGSAAANLREGISGLTEVVRREAEALRTLDLAGTQELTAQLQERERRVLAAVSGFDARLAEAASHLTGSATTLGQLSADSSRSFAEAAKTAADAAKVFVAGLEKAADNIVEATRRRASQP
ncbi:MAG: hypothetical protein ABIU97_03985 [Dehalococcoidia bacterium]